MIHSLDVYINEFLRIDVPAVMGKISLRGTFTGTMKGGLKGTMLRVRSNSVKDASQQVPAYDKSKAFFYTKVSMLFENSISNVFFFFLF
jgi:hypothetical protein